MMLTLEMIVLDDDMNGLIKIKEVNDFTNAKPEELTLMKWIVYCAYGKPSVLVFPMRNL